MFTTESEEYVNTWYNKLPEDLYNHTTQILYNFKVFVSCLTPKVACKEDKKDIYLNFLIEEALGQLKLSVYKVLKEHEFKSTEKMMSIPTLFKRALHSSQLINYFCAVYKNDNVSDKIIDILSIAPGEREMYSKEYLDNIYLHSPYAIPNLTFYNTWPKDFQAIVKQMPMNNLNKRLAYISYESADEYNDALFAILHKRVITNANLFSKYLKINCFCSMLGISHEEYMDHRFKKEQIFIKKLHKTVKDMPREEYIEIMWMYVMMLCTDHYYSNTDRLEYFKKFIEIDGFKEFYTRMLLENQPMTFYLNLLNKKYAEKPVKCNNKVIKFML